MDLDREKLRFDGKPVREAERRYILLYKPKGYPTTYKDPEGRPTVTTSNRILVSSLAPLGGWIWTRPGCCC